MFKPIKLEGAGVVLRSPDVRDFESICGLFNNSQTMHYLQEMTKPNGWTIPEIEERHYRRQAREEKGELIQFVVHDFKTGEFLGTSGFPTLDLKSKTAERGLILLPTAWGKGVYTAINWLTFHYAFEELGIETMEFDTHPKNEKIIRFLEKIGAKKDSKKPDHLMINDQKIPRVIYTLSVSEWPRVKKLLHAKLQTLGRI